MQDLTPVLAALGGAAYGYPRYSSAVLVQGLLGVAAWFSFVRLNAQAVVMILDRTPGKRSKSPNVSPEATTKPGSTK